MRIKQARVSRALPFFNGRFHERYGLGHYHWRDKPTVFLGYSRTLGDAKAVEKHETPFVFVWAGSDAKRLLRNPTDYAPLFGPRVHHVAQSSFISESLTDAGVPHTRLNINCATPEVFRPCPLGDSVYCYIPRDQGWKHGQAILDEVRAALPDTPFIVSNGSWEKPQSEMPAVYAQCFMGLRLTPHDGLAHMVTEMGLMGRRCVWNGEAPGALSWETADDVVRLIGYETDADRVGIWQPNDLAAAMAEFLDIGDDWLDTDFYKNSRAAEILATLDAPQELESKLTTLLEKHEPHKAVIELIKNEKLTVSHDAVVRATSSRLQPETVGV